MNFRGCQRQSRCRARDGGRRRRPPARRARRCVSRSSPIRRPFARARDRPETAIDPASPAPRRGDCRGDTRPWRSRAGPRCEASSNDFIGGDDLDFPIVHRGALDRRRAAGGRVRRRARPVSPLSSVINNRLLQRASKGRIARSMGLCGSMRCHAPSEQKITLGHRQLARRLADQQFPVGAHLVGLRVDFDVRLRAVVNHVLLANLPRAAHRFDPFAQREALERRSPRAMPSRRISAIFPRARPNAANIGR